MLTGKASDERTGKSLLLSNDTRCEMCLLRIAKQTASCKCMRCQDGIWHMGVHIIAWLFVSTW